MEGHRQDYIDSYISYVEMLKITYSLVTKGKLFVTLYSQKLTTFLHILLHSEKIL